MRILMITDNLIRGGKERRLIELLKYFEGIEDVKLTLVILKNQVHYPEIYELKKTEFLIFSRKTKKDFSIFSKLNSLCRKFKPDVIHSWGSMPSVYIAGIAKINRIPFINGMITHGKVLPFEKDRIRAKLTFPFSTKILANSYAGLKAYNVKKKGVVIYNGFDFSRLNIVTPEEEIRKLYNIKTKYIVGMVAAFFIRKDYATYLEAAKVMCENRDDITFLAIGDGNDLENYKKKYEGIDNIIFTGNVDKVEDIIRIFTIGVLLTNHLVHDEGISNAILEMMALGKPVIATKGGGTDELITEESFGIKIPPASKVHLIEAIENLLSSKELCMKIAKNAKSRIEKVFSIENMGKQTLQLYKQVVKS